MIKTNHTSLQDHYLNLLRKENITATFYLVNGFQIKGKIMGFDNFIVIIEADSRQQMVYKHALSTVLPSKNIDVSSYWQEEQAANENNTLLPE